MEAKEDIAPAPRLPEPRGPLTEILCDRLRESPAARFETAPELGDVDGLADDDLHLALYLCYELHYRGLAGVDSGWEWEPSLIGFRNGLESRFLSALTEELGPAPDIAPEELGAAVFRMVAEDEGASLSRFLQNRATVDQFREFVMHRSAYQLKEADPHSWVIPRLAGAAKASLLEVQFDEYGGGDAERLHATLFAKSMRALGLDDRYGAYVGLLPGMTLATVNLMSFLGLHRRWRGAIVGHLAAFEISSAIPNRRYANGLRRLGFGEDATDFFDEHVEADSVHENIAAYDLAQRFALDSPQLTEDLLFGARALLAVDGHFAERVLAKWQAGESSLRHPVPAVSG
jgi:hypothetical protein